MPKAHFDITGDNRNFVSVIADTVRRMEELSKVMNDLGKSFDISSPEKQMKALREAIKGNKAVIAQYEQELKELAKAQKEAALSGDTSLAEKIGMQMQTAATRMQETITETDQLKSALSELGVTVDSTGGLMERMLGGTENYQKIIAGLPPGLRMVITEMNGLKNTFSAVMATPIAPFLLALATVVSTLTSYFKGAADGQMEFARISGYASGVINKLKDYAIAAGRELVNAFNTVLPFIKKVATAAGGLVDIFGGLFGILSKGVKGMISGDWEDFKKQLDQIKNGFKTLVTGEGNNPQLNALDEVGRKTSELAVQERELNIQRKKWAVEEAKLDEKIADARVKMMSATGAERNKYAKEYQDLTNQKYDKQLEFAQQELDIVKERNSLTENTQEDFNREYELEARLYQLRAQKKQSSGYAARLEASSGRQMARQGEQQEQLQKQIQEELNSVLQSNTEKRIAMMEAGGKKELATIEANYKKQMDSIRKQRERWQKENKKAGLGTSLTQSQLAAIMEAEAIAAQEKEKQINDRVQKNREQYIQQFGTYEEKLALLMEQKNKEWAATNIFDEYEVALFRKKWQKLFKDLEHDYSANYALIFADAGNLSDTYLAQAITATQEEIANARKSGDIQALAELYKRLQSQLSEQGGRKGVFAGLIGGFKDLQKAREALDKAVAADDATEMERQLNAEAAALEQIKQKAKEAGNWISSISSSLRSFDLKGLNAVADLFDALKNSVVDIAAIFAQDGKEITDTVKQGAVVASLDAVLSLISLIGNSVANNREAQKEWNRTIIQSAHNLAMLDLNKLDYKQRNIFGAESPYKKAIDGATQYGAAIEKLQGDIDKLNAGQVQVGTKKALDWKAIGQGFAKGAGAGASIGGVAAGVASGGIFAFAGAALGAAIGGVVGAATGAFATKTEPIFESLSSKYGQLVMEDYSLNPQLLADYDKLDEDTKQLIDNWEEIKEKAQEAEEQMRENFADLAGDVGTQLSDALVNAFKNGNLYDAIEDFHTTMTRTIESILSQLVFSNVFGDLFDTLEKNMMDSFGVGGDQDITDDLREFEKRYPDLMSAYGDAMTAVQESMKALGYDVFSDSAVREEGSVGSFKGMSQATGTALEGRFTAVQIATEMIAERMITNLALMTTMNEYMAGSNTTLSEIRDAHIREVGYLEDIARQTRPISTLIGMGDDLKTIANKL